MVQLHQIRPSLITDANTHDRVLGVLSGKGCDEGVGFHVKPPGEGTFKERCLRVPTHNRVFSPTERPSNNCSSVLEKFKSFILDGEQDQTALYGRTPHRVAWRTPDGPFPPASSTSFSPCLQPCAGEGLPEDPEVRPV